MTTGELTISLLIIAVVLFAAWRGGQRNPVGTGRLALRMDALELKVAQHGERLNAIEQAMLTLADKAGSIDTGVQALRIEIAGDRSVLEKTWEATDRMQNYFIEEGLRRRGGR